MSDLTETLDTDAIRARAADFQACDEGPGVPSEVWGLVSSASARDVPALLDEVERLRAGIAYIVDRYGNAPGIETCATMYDLRRLVEETP